MSIEAVLQAELTDEQRAAATDPTSEVLWLNLHKGTKCEIGIARDACLGAVESAASEVTGEPVTCPVPVGHRSP